ncbi:hypothetical protein [Lysinibacillus xylanilyticus]|uniref:hypothetical protein n=1 Tax=Lysinibacillus xylanilyticus TaxID=582475 RepID=UPI00083C9642|nr:hypothetical protein [Lysinibacillus xylanilyticus]
MLHEDQVISSIMRNEGKGAANTIVGATEAGKSTLFAGMAKGEKPSELLSERASSGKGSLVNAEINITDDPEIDENKLYIHGRICKKTVADVGDDNKLLGSVLFSAAKECSQNKRIDNNTFENKIEKTLNIALKTPSNDSLAYKIAAFGTDEKKRVVEIISGFPINDMVELYEEVMAIQKANNKKGQYANNLFSEKIGTIKNLERYVNEFWTYVIECLNSGVEQFKQILNEMQEITYVGVEDDGENEFFVVLSGDDTEQKIRDILLKSENGSKEYLLSKLSFVFRGADWVFEDPEIDMDAFVVSEYNDMKIHVIRFIDTMGLFHEQGKETGDEYERILDILSQYHSEKVIFVISSDVNATAKNGYQAMREFLTKAKGNIGVYLMFTKWDTFMQSKVSENVGQNRFTRRKKIEISWNEIFTTSSKEQDELIQSFESSVFDNSSKNKPLIKGIFKYGLISGNDELDTCLEENNVVYEHAISKLICALNRAEKNNGNKIRIKVIEDKAYSLLVDTDRRISVSALFYNLVAECKDKKLYASTVAACIRKWKICVPHFSKVLANQYGYENIETKFVLEIGNYAKELSRNAINLNPEIVLGGDEEITFLKEIINRKISNDIGKKFAAKVLDDSYKNGFSRNSDIYMTQHKRFSNLLQYTQDNYFSSSRIIATQYIIECFEKATFECINDVFNENCIIVY